MIKLTLSAAILCRTPVFCTSAVLEKSWNQLKELIRESSPSFFQIIEDTGPHEIGSLDQKTQFTIWKYFNRARFRATPYGNFAAYTLLQCGDREEQLTISRQFQSRRFINWKETESLIRPAAWLLKHAEYFRSNTAVYRCGNELRYLSMEDGAFAVSAIPDEAVTAATLEFCHTRRTITELYTFLLAQYGLDKKLSDYFLRQLLEHQLLFTPRLPNITGTDFFTRIGYKSDTSATDYVLAAREGTGQVNARNLQVLTEVAGFLQQHLPAGSSTALKDFRRKFSRRFEGKSVPLLVAMDPETGVGYMSLTQDKAQDPLIAELNAAKERTREQHPMHYTALHQFILNQLLQQETVTLHDFKGQPSGKPVPVANTISCMVRFSETHLLVSQMGGVTANALLGRFSLGSEEVTSVCRQFAALEEQANPDILFFDIAYQLEKHADNINRRNNIYTCELPLLSWSESGQLIDLDDIMVRVNGDTITLYSASRNKRIVPRLASAYNYTRSDLAVYRFLSDLQHQHLHTALGIDLRQMFPGLQHYQRVVYRNVILSPEKWRVPDNLCQGNPAQHTDALYHWLSTQRVSRLFRAGDADQTLLFDSGSAADMLYFLQFCQHRKDLYIEEAFITPENLVRDEQGTSYSAEMVVHLQHNSRIYTPYSAPASQTGPADISTTLLPGDEWLYFEIYCHSSRSDGLLQYLDSQLIRGLRKQLKGWFFIRYNDPSDHIRLRLQLNSVNDIAAILTRLNELLKPHVDTGIISDIQLKTYRRETLRYGLSCILKTEKFFYLNSRLAMAYLAKPQAVPEGYALSINLMEAVWEASVTSSEEQLIMAAETADYFAAEMQIGVDGFKKINQAFKTFSTRHSGYCLPVKQQQMLQQNAASISGLLAAAPPELRRQRLRDLFHMHVNRLFSSDQRMHEMMIYQYLVKRLKIKKGKLKSLS